MKIDEHNFLRELQKRQVEGSVYVRELVEELKINEKRACFICEKWIKKGWYDCGVSMLAGWLTKKGLEQIMDRKDIEKLKKKMLFWLKIYLWFEKLERRHNV